MWLTISSPYLDPIPSDPAECAAHNPVYNADGTYLKSICLMCDYIGLPYDGAVTQCKSLGMELIVVDSSVESTLFAFARYIFNGETGSTLYVSGRNSSGCNMISKVKDPNFALDQIDCATNMCFFCEYVVGCK